MFLKEIISSFLALTIRVSSIGRKSIIYLLIHKTVVEQPQLHQVDHLGSQEFLELGVFDEIHLKRFGLSN